MKILIVSDSHGRTTHLEGVLEKIGPIDLLIHLGDIEGSEDYIEAIANCDVAMVSGNNDYFTSLERDKIIVVNGYKIFLTHGHRYQVNYGTETIKEKGRQIGADIVMFGHTHRPLIDTSGDIMAINPGSISQPRQEGHIPTYIIMEIDRHGELHFTLNYVK
ncbi:hypothetical protein EDD66_104337 [Mobilisporobacter senegalensis]|uniref:Phosphoesterase n=1 Tax=Mobilisporobacter senegalensis TaxID=1329262 RepID=A0A3N1XRH4_9FIRM|nr:metallophosphoesterase [Mobilisporobacter senegalensis]ROR28741.1 hypothetical protein EDD66_104337 [Mobilisporobacter senegalensis]